MNRSHRADRAADEPDRKDGRGGAGELSAYDRVTVSMWRHSHASLAAGGAPPGQRGLAEAAAHAVLVGLRRCVDARALFARYDHNPSEQRDFALIASLLPGGCADSGGGDGGGGGDSLLRGIREAAFHLRWLELRAAGGAP